MSKKTICVGRLTVIEDGVEKKFPSLDALQSFMLKEIIEKETALKSEAQTND